jgi:hypothetical protein
MTRMPFGKYAGLDLADVPRPYLRWLRRRPWLGAWLVREIDAELGGDAVASSGESFEEALAKWKWERDGKGVRSGEAEK